MRSLIRPGRIPCPYRKLRPPRLSDGGRTAIVVESHRPYGAGLSSPDNAAEAAVVEEIDVIAVRFLGDAVGFLTGELAIEPTFADRSLPSGR